MRAPRTFTRPLVSSVVAGLLVACGGSDGPTPPDDGTDIERVTVSPDQATVEVGGTQQLSAQVVQKNGDLSSTLPSWSAEPEEIVTVSAAGLVTGLAAGSAVVRAVAEGQSGETAITVAEPLPAAPSAVAAEPRSHTVIEVSWTDNADNEESFRVERETVAGDPDPGKVADPGTTAPATAKASRAPQTAFGLAATVGPDVTSYRDEGLDPGMRYRYRVLACNARGCAPDGEASETTTGAATTHEPLVVETTAVASGVVGVPYTAQLVANGGSGVYVWSLAGGALADDVSLTGTGAVEGTPTVAGSFTASVQVESGEQTAVFELTLHIDGVQPLDINTESFPDARVAMDYDVAIDVTGGTPPYAFSVVTGSTPDGIALGPTDGVLAGVPALEASAALTVRVEDQAGASAERELALTVCPAVLDLALGGHAVVALPDRCGAVLPDAEARYRVALLPRSIADGAAYVPGGLELSGTAGVPGQHFTVPPRVQNISGPAARMVEDGLPAGIRELAARTAALHHMLREAELQARPNVPGAPANRFGPPLPVAARARVAKAAPEASRTFMVAPSTGPRVPVTATLMGQNDEIWYYVDDAVLGTASEPAQTRIDALLAYYAAYGRPIIDEVFGGLGPAGSTQNFKDDEGNVLTLPMDDLDQNGGRIVVLQIRPSHMPSGAAAYVSSCDRYPKSLDHLAGGPFYCPGSNQAEITYVANPESDFYLGSLVHEVKHISSHGYAVFGGRGFNPSWIEEGTAEVAKEKSSRAAAGFADTDELGLADVYPGGSLTAETFGMAVVLSRARSYLAAAPINSLYGTPAPNPNQSTFYGASWLFHRFLLDNFAGGDENAFLRSLNVGGSGVSRIEQVAGRNFATLLADFVLAAGVEGRLGARAAASRRFRSYDFGDISDGFGGDWPYVHTTSGFSSGTVTLTNAVYGGPSYFDFDHALGPESTALRLDVSGAEGAALAPDDDVAMIIVRIR